MTLLVGGALLWAVGRTLAVPELFVVAAVSVSLVGVGAVAAWVSSASVSARRGVSERRLLHGAVAQVTTELRNDARWDTTGVLLVEDTCPPELLDGDSIPRSVVGGIRPGRTVSLAYPVRGNRRGRLEVGPLRIRIRDPFGVAERVRRYTATDQVVVYPRIEPLAERLPHGAHRTSEGSDTRRLLNTGDEFYTMREYLHGDDLRRIHWPTTARRGRLMVRQHELPWQVQATIFCDTRLAAHRGHGAGSSVEQAISVAASLVWHLADEGYRLRLLNETDTRPPGVQHWTVLLDRLAELQPSSLPSLRPALMRLRGSGAEGLLIAVLSAQREGFPARGVSGGANPPVSRGVSGGATSPAFGDPGLRALMQAGRSFSARLAVVVPSVDDPPSQQDRSEELAAVLRASGWRAAALTPGEPLRDRWAELTAPAARRGRARAVPGGDRR
jgi:uncharacterized protein (DUF58 family)